MSKPRNRTATPRPEPPSSPISEPPLPVTPEETCLPFSAKAPESERPAFYLPPGVDRSIPLQPPFETGENPSSTKSSTILTSQKTEEPIPDLMRSPDEVDEVIPVERTEVVLDIAPPRCPVQGAGGREYLEWAARNMGDKEFSEHYAHRARHLMELHGELLGDVTRQRLERQDG